MSDQTTVHDWEELDALKIRVQLGSKLLDQIRPDWYKDIDTTQLKMMSCRRCVLGQLFGDFDDALAEIFPGGDWGIARGSYHGFNLPHHLQHHRWENVLTTLWVIEINLRRNNDLISETIPALHETINQLAKPSGE